MIVLIDTNVMLPLFSKKPQHAEIIQALIAGRIRLALSQSILSEYAEILIAKMGDARWARVLALLDLLARTGRLIAAEPSYEFHIITDDPDDNKFTDCAITAHADYIITEDKDFAALANAGYKPQPTTPQEFIQRHLKAE